MIDLFRQWDDDGSGRVCKKEFRRALPEIGCKVPKQVANAVFDLLDPDGSGEIEYSELRAMLRKGASMPSMSSLARDSTAASVEKTEKSDRRAAVVRPVHPDRRLQSSGARRWATAASRMGGRVELEHGRRKPAGRVAMRWFQRSARATLANEVDRAWQPRQPPPVAKEARRTARPRGLALGLQPTPLPQAALEFEERHKESYARGARGRPGHPPRLVAHAPLHAAQVTRGCGTCRRTPRLPSWRAASRLR